MRGMKQKTDGIDTNPPSRFCMKAKLWIAVIGFIAILVLLLGGTLLFRSSLMEVKYEYRVCFVQGTRVTFVNGVWQGGKPMELADPQGSMDSCPEKWIYLESAGAEGWELVAVVELTHVKEDSALELYLKRRIR
jgi:hypothetical protein